MTSDVRDLVATLRTLHDDLATVLAELSHEQLRAHSYATEWTVSDVVSHLGSGAELMLLGLDSGTEDGPAPEDSAAIWAVWNARTPEQQVVEGVVMGERLVARLEQLEDGSLEVLRRNLGGLQLDAAGMLRLRVSEQAMHGWDIAVALDDSAAVPAAAVPAMLELLPVTLRFAAQPHDDVLSVDLTLSEPDRALRLDLRHGETRVSAAGGTGVGNPGTTSATSTTNATSATSAGATLELPAEAFLRLVYGRLDPRHTPPVKVSDDALLTRLREIFRGF
jgi:uncharacterized protein (TIGR03083 family)